MKKIAKRVITAVLAMAMVIGMMAMTAFAADDTYSVIGSINGNWDKDTDLVKQADGTYSVDITDVKAGSYEFKIRTNHAWDNGEYNLEGDASSGGANAKVDVAKDGSTVTVTFDGTKAAVTVKEAGKEYSPAYIANYIYSSSRRFFSYGIHRSSSCSIKRSCSSCS